MVFVLVKDPRLARGLTRNSTRANMCNHVGWTWCGAKPPLEWHVQPYTQLNYFCNSPWIYVINLLVKWATLSPLIILHQICFCSVKMMKCNILEFRGNGEVIWFSSFLLQRRKTFPETLRLLTTVPSPCTLWESGLVLALRISLWNVTWRTFTALWETQCFCHVNPAGTSF